VVHAVIASTPRIQATANAFVLNVSCVFDVMAVSSRAPRLAKGPVATTRPFVATPSNVVIACISRLDAPTGGNADPKNRGGRVHAIRGISKRL
jgi:hypothetical protein